MLQTFSIFLIYWRHFYQTFSLHPVPHPDIAGGSFYFRQNYGFIAEAFKKDLWIRKRARKALPLVLAEIRGNFSWLLRLFHSRWHFQFFMALNYLMVAETSWLVQRPFRLGFQKGCQKTFQQSMIQKLLEGLLQEIESNLVSALTLEPQITMKDEVDFIPFRVVPVPNFFQLKLDFTLRWTVKFRLILLTGHWRLDNFCVNEELQGTWAIAWTMLSSFVVQQLNKCEYVSLLVQLSPLHLFREHTCQRAFISNSL